MKANMQFLGDTGVAHSADEIPDLGAPKSIAALNTADDCATYAAAGFHVALKHMNATGDSAAAEAWSVAVEGYFQAFALTIDTSYTPASFVASFMQILAADDQAAVAFSLEDPVAKAKLPTVSVPATAGSPPATSLDIAKKLYTPWYMSTWFLGGVAIVAGSGAAWAWGRHSKTRRRRRRR